MSEERRAKQFENVLRDLAAYAGRFEYTSMYPGAEVINAAFSADRVLIRGREQYYEPALKITGMTYTNGDLVNVLYIQGAEPIALSQAPGSAGSGLPVHTHSSTTQGGQNLRAIDELEFDDATQLTIDGAGAITRTQVYHAIETNGGAGTDDLDTINGGSEGDLLIIRPYDGTHTVVVRHNVGNIWLSGAANLSLDDIGDHLVLIYDGTNAQWCDIGWSAGGAAGGWPFTGKVITVDSTDADADFATLALAIADAGTVAGDTILLSSETHACHNVTLTDGVHLVGQGIDATILQTATQQFCLQVGLNSLVSNLAVKSTYPTAAAYAIYMHTLTDTSRFINVRAETIPSAGAFNSYAWYVVGDSELIDCVGITNSGGSGYAYVGAGLGDKRIVNGYFDGSGVAGGDDINNQAGTTLLVNPILENSSVDTLLGATGAQGGWYDTGGEQHFIYNGDDIIPKEAPPLKVKNTSGGVVAKGDLGYIDDAGEYKETATAYLTVDWCVVLIGGANNADIYVARRGLVTVTLNGNCAIGDKLYTSTTAGQAQPQSYVRPEMLAVTRTANAAGAGGTCVALLYCGSSLVPLTNVDTVYRSGALVNDSDFNGTIAGLPGGAVLTYNIVSGDENIMDAFTATELAKLRLYNSTRATYALILDTVTATNTITLTANVPVGWQVGDSITIRSQVNLDVVGASYYLEYEIISTDIPELARAILVEVTWLDTGAAGERITVHPWEAFAAGKRMILDINVAGRNVYGSKLISLIQRRYTVQWSASGAGTAYYLVTLTGAIVAAP